MIPSTVNGAIPNTFIQHTSHPPIRVVPHPAIRTVTYSSSAQPILPPSIRAIPQAEIFQTNNGNQLPRIQVRPVSAHAASEPLVTGIPRGWHLWHNGRNLSLRIEELVGEGTFGKVYKARILETNDVVAIKQVEMQKGYELREVDILLSLHHRNICRMKMSFTVPRAQEKFDAYIVMEYIPCSLYDVIKRCRRMKRRMTEKYIMLLTYQLLNGLEYLHSKGICHRDLKPANILLNLTTNELKICDFGSAKKLRDGHLNATYICSRFYRAPEVILSCQYTDAMDIWSVGCIFVELYRSEILFKGGTSLDQLIEIIKVMGTPSEDDLKELGRQSVPFALRICPPKQWREILGRGVGKEAIDLISKMLVYSPMKRIKAAQALRHPYFDPLRDPNFSVALGPLPQLFDNEADRLNIHPEENDEYDVSTSDDSTESFVSTAAGVLPFV